MNVSLDKFQVPIEYMGRLWMIVSAENERQAAERGLSQFKESHAPPNGVSVVTGTLIAGSASIAKDGKHKIGRV